jgi:hypothetical protein
MPLTIKSPAFQSGDNIPKKFSCEGEDISPQLEWSNYPSETKSFALICEDPDAPGGTFTHWIIYDIPTSRNSFPENVPNELDVFDGVKQGKNNFGKIGYGGPCPPAGSAHRYFFRVYALDNKLNIKEGLSKDDLMNKIKSHILEEGELIGLYKKSGN